VKPLGTTNNQTALSGVVGRGMKKEGEGGEVGKRKERNEEKRGEKEERRKMERNFDNHRNKDATK
jgi:hypothetical protein